MSQSLSILKTPLLVLLQCVIFFLLVIMDVEHFPQTRGARAVRTYPMYHHRHHHHQHQRNRNRQTTGDQASDQRRPSLKCRGSIWAPASSSSLPATPSPSYLSSPSSSPFSKDRNRSQCFEGGEIDPRYGVDKRLVPTGPNPLHN
ncbi:hypothetical protein KP509_38G046300 [Ceratopteris richardii]|uniref:Uncharacterized protein n=1 Tax=Ceratopteris richardii TaxID=49495 RepID=A0A8T2Q4J0_CERRI|nr:hypothetical protein KP509_38G046300 [Ceratopteris richardii]